MKEHKKNISALLLGFAFVGFVLTTVLVLNVSPASGQIKKPLVDLNSASEKELEALPGVGPATSKKIVANRPYKSADELSKAGLSSKSIETLKPLVTVGSTTPPRESVTKAPAPPAPAKESSTKVPAPATPAKAASITTGPTSLPKSPPPSTKLAPGQKVNINTASKAQLEALPGIGPFRAQHIIEGRPYGKIEDIMKVKTIKQGEFNKIKDLITVK